MSILTSLPCAKVFYVSRTSLKIDAEYGLYTDRKRRLAYNPIDFDHPPAATGNPRKLIGVGDDVLLIGTACRVAAIKSPELFTEVMCRVVARLDFVHAVIMGDGPCMTQVRQILTNLPTLMLSSAMGGMVWLIGKAGLSVHVAMSMQIAAGGVFYLTLAWLLRLGPIVECWTFVRKRLKNEA